MSASEQSGAWFIVLGENILDQSPYWAGPALAVFAPLVEENMKWTYAIPAGAVLSAALFWVVDGIRQRRAVRLRRDIAIAPESGRNHQDRRAALSQEEAAGRAPISNRDVTLHQLLVRDTVVEGRTFEDSVIHGPAVAAFVRSPLVECEFVGPSRDSIVLPIWPARSVVGLTVIRDCSFTRCTFVDIALAGMQERHADSPRNSGAPT